MTSRIKIHKAAVFAAYNAVELAKQRHVAFQWTIKAISGNRYADARVKEAIQVVYSALVETELEAYRRLFMMAIILPDDLLQKAKEEVMNRFIKEGYSIMEYLDVDCKHPDVYYGPDRETFRELMLESLREDNDA